MAEGDDAAAAGYSLVPDTGDDGLIRWGAREINRTRDFIARMGRLFPTGKGGYRTAAGISSGYSDPSGGENGDLYFKIVG